MKHEQGGYVLRAIMVKMEAEEVERELKKSMKRGSSGAKFGNSRRCRKVDGQGDRVCR